MGTVLCPGELLVDFVSAENKKISEAECFYKKAGGAPANAAVAIHRFGADAIFTGCVGKDSFGNFLINTLQKTGLSTEYIKRSNINTTLAFVSDGFEFIRGADKKLQKDDIPDELIKKSVIIHLSSATAFLGGELEKTYNYLLTFNDKIISFDPNYRPALFPEVSEFIEKSKEFIRHSHIVKASEKEAKLISGKTSLDEAINYLLGLGAENVFITRGEKGTVYANKNRCERIPSIKVECVDSTGAGDAFIGTLLAQLSDYTRKELNFELIKKYVYVSNVAAALTVTKKGAIDAIPDKQTTLNHISQLQL
ncbi:MAG: carbohydrate kinase family protein [Candidatus Nanoarchaeia archaeon]